MAVRAVIQCQTDIELLGNPDGRQHVVRAVCMTLERNFPADNRQHGLKLRIIRTLLGAVLLRFLDFFSIPYGLFQSLTQQGCDTHARNRRFASLLSIAALRVLAECSLHGNRILDNHVIHYASVQLDGRERAADDIGGARTRDGSRNAAAQSQPERLILRVDAVNAAHVRRHRIRHFIIVSAFPANCFLIQTDVRMGIDQTGRNDAALCIEYLRALRDIQVRADCYNFSFVDEHLAVHQIRPRDRFYRTALNQ